MEKAAVAIIELASLYKGFEVQDAILKGAAVQKLIARTICSGKYFMIFSGDAADTETAVEIAKNTGGFAVINAAAITNLDPKVLPAISGCTILEKNEFEKPGAILVLETFSVITAIKAADQAIKKANLELTRIHVAMAIGGKGLVIMTGDIAALEAAADAAAECCRRDGMLAGYTIIKNPHEDILKDLI